MRVLVTGATGFAGSHLTDALLDEDGYEVVAVGRAASPPPNLAHCIDKIRYVRQDLEDTDGIRAVLDEHRPELVFHLAAQSFVPAYEIAWADAALRELNITLNLYESVAAGLAGCRFVLISSAQVYGATFNEADGPLDESATVRPLSIYGATKLTLEHFADVARSQYGLDAVILRPFNHIGPRQAPQFVCASLAMQIAEIEKGVREPIVNVGNLDAERDFTDVRDMVRAYILAARRCKPGVPCNVCSGEAVSIRAVLDMYMELSGVSAEIVSEPQRHGGTEFTRVWGDPEFFGKCTGWSSAYSLTQSLEDTLDYWRNRIEPKTGS